MTRREELAEKILLAMLGNQSVVIGDGERLRESAFQQADAFLAACEPEPEREPDAVWTLDGSDVWNESEEGWDNHCRKLRAGRDRVRLRVFVEEVGKP